MPILTSQKRGRQLGEIRLGTSIVGANGKARPSKLQAFRFTTKSETAAHAVATALGGTVKATTLLNGEATFEVLTDATTLSVMVPPGDAAISQWFEMWSKGGCQRRCDGVTEQLTQSPCMCPADREQRNTLAATGGACKPTTRVNVILPDLPDLGVWLVQSHGFNAAAELGGAAELLANARAQGVTLPATLRMEQRQSASGGVTRKFAVPVLEIGATLREMVALSPGGGIAAALPPAPVKAIAAPTAPAIEAAPRAVVEAVLPDEPDDDEPDITVYEDRADAATDMPTIAALLAEVQAKRLADFPRAVAPDGTTLTLGEYIVDRGFVIRDGLDAPPPYEPNDDPTPQRLSKKQLIDVQTGFKQLGITDRGDRLNIVNSIIDVDPASERTVRTTNDLTFREATAVIDRINHARRQSDPIAYLMGVNPETAEVVDGGVFDNPGYEPAVDES